MSARSHAKARRGIAAQTDALHALIEDSAIVLGEGEAEAGVGPLEPLRAMGRRVEERTSRSPEHTVIGFFGATGSGKSSLVNALVGSDVARVAHRRPTTSQALAAIVTHAGPERDSGRQGPRGRGAGEAADTSLLDGAHDLLDWLEIHERVEVPARGLEPGMMVVDLPDFDSVEAANREVAERLAGLVDVLVWVTDPEKYADAVLHSEFIAPLARPDATTIGIVNQADRLSDQDQLAVRDSFAELLAQDGLEDATVLTTSALTGQGIDSARDAFSAVAKKKAAALQRLRADLASTAKDFAPRVGATDTGRTYVIDDLAEHVPAHATENLVDTCARAARIDGIAQAVRSSYTQRASAHTGWPLLRWIGRMRPDPLKRLHITEDAGRTEGSFVARSSLDLDSPTATAHINRGLDDFRDALVGDAPRPWPGRMYEVVEAHNESLPERLDYAVSSTPMDGARSSWFWTPLNIVQWLALLCAVVGLGWLLALAGFDFLQIPKPPLPMIEGLWIPVPVPTALIVFGVLLGVLVALFAQLANRMVAASRERNARETLRTAIRNELIDTVVASAEEELQRATRIEQHLRALRGV